MHGVNPLCIAAQSSRFTSSHQVVGQRTESDRTADGIRLDGERNPIGRRTESDRTADGIRSDGGRNPIGRRTESVTEKRVCQKSNKMSCKPKSIDF